MHNKTNISRYSVCIYAVCVYTGDIKTFNKWYSIFIHQSECHPPTTSTILLGHRYWLVPHMWALYNMNKTLLQVNFQRLFALTAQWTRIRWAALEKQPTAGEDSRCFLGDYTPMRAVRRGQISGRGRECGVKKHRGRKKWWGCCTEGPSQSWRMRSEHFQMENEVAGWDFNMLLGTRSLYSL